MTATITRARRTRRSPKRSAAPSPSERADGGGAAAGAAAARVAELRSRSRRHEEAAGVDGERHLGRRRREEQPAAEGVAEHQRGLDRDPRQSKGVAVASSGTRSGRAAERAASNGGVARPARKARTEQRRRPARRQEHGEEAAPPGPQSATSITGDAAEAVGQGGQHLSDADEPGQGHGGDGRPPRPGEPVRSSTRTVSASRPAQSPSSEIMSAAQRLRKARQRATGRAASPTTPRSRRPSPPSRGTVRLDDGLRKDYHGRVRRERELRRVALVTSSWPADSAARLVRAPGASATSRRLGSPTGMPAAMSRARWRRTRNQIQTLGGRAGPGRGTGRRSGPRTRSSLTRSASDAKRADAVDQCRRSPSRCQDRAAPCAGGGAR